MRCVRVCESARSIVTLFFIVFTTSSFSIGHWPVTFLFVTRKQSISPIVFPNSNNRIRFATTKFVFPVLVFLGTIYKLVESPQIAVISNSFLFFHLFSFWLTTTKFTKPSEIFIFLSATTSFSLSATTNFSVPTSLALPTALPASNFSLPASSFPLPAPPFVLLPSSSAMGLSPLQVVQFS